MIRLSLHARRRWVRQGLAAVFGLITLFLLWRAVTSGKDQVEDQLLEWFGVFFGLVATVMATAQLLPARRPPRDADQEADSFAITMHNQWVGEVAARNLRTPRVIPLSWSATRRPVAPPPEETHGNTIDARVLRLALNGRLDGNFNEAVRRLAQGYRRVPSGRLVVLGEPGSGKTALATMLTVGLLAEREPGSPVPVLLTLSGWNPAEPLADWVERSLGTAHFAGPIDIPRLLLRSHRLLLILDGLDEMPEVLRRIAVTRINEFAGDGTGVVLTCRSAEYQDVIEGGSPVLSRAPVVEVAPVSTDDAIAYLKDVSWPAGVDWAPVYADLRTNPEGPTAVALSTPLTLSLARTVYSSLGRDPSELLDIDSPHATEDHLLGHVIPAAYAPVPGRSGQPNTEEWRRTAKRAEKYLTYLATYLQEHHERDLVWWIMSRRLSSRLTGFSLGIICALLATFAMVGVFSLVESDGTGSATESAINQSLMVGVSFGILIMIIWYAIPGESLGGLSFTRQDSLKRLGKGFATGLKITIVIILAVSLTVSLLTVLAGVWTELDRDLIIMLTVGACGVALAVSCALAAHAWLSANPEGSHEASPWGLLRQDRRSSLVGSLAAGMVLGIAAVPLFIIFHSLAFILYSRIAHGPVVPSPTGFIIERFQEGVYDSTPAGVTSALLPAVIFALLVLITRAWPRFLLMRLTLAFQGKLPWKLMRFLSDARGRQLLRQSAGAYQFRHIRLQERLARPTMAPADDTTRVRSGGRRRTVVTTVATAAPILLLAGLVAMPDRPEVTFIETGEVEVMTFSSEGNLVTVDRELRVKQWSTKTGKELAHLRNQMELDGDPDSWEYMAVEEGFLSLEEGEEDYFSQVWMVVPWQGGAKKVWSPGKPGWDADAIWGADAISSDGRYWLTVYMDAREQFEVVTLVDRENENKELVCEWHRNDVGWTWQISSNGETVAAEVGSVGGFGYIAWGNFADCNEFDAILVGYGKIKSFALSADGGQLAVNVDGRTRLQALED